MIKILLVEPAKILTDIKKRSFNFQKYVWPSLGLMSIATTLNENGCFVKYFSPSLEFKKWKPKLKKLLIEHQFDYVGISNTIYTIGFDMAIAHFVKKILPETTIITGGYFSHYYPKLILQHTEVDVVIRGEGETPLLRIVKGEKNLAKIPGACFRYLQLNQEKYFIQKPFFMNDSQFKKISPLNFSFYDHHKIWRKWPKEIKKAVQIYTSKGCPFACRFCSVPYFNDRKLRFLPLQTIKTNIVNAACLGATKIHISDPNFNAQRKHCLSICNLIVKLKKERKIPDNLSFSAQVRIETISNKLLNKFTRAGFNCLMIGIENVSPRLIKNDINKKNYLDKETILGRINLIASCDIAPYIYLILGIPTTTLEEVVENIKFADLLIKNKIEVDLNPFISPFPETEYYKIYKDTSQIVWEKVNFMRRRNNKSIKYSMKIPRSLKPINNDARKFLRLLWFKTNRIVQKNGGDFSRTFINEAVKMIKIT